MSNLVEVDLDNILCKCILLLHFARSVSGEIHEAHVFEHAITVRGVARIHYIDSVFFLSRVQIALFLQRHWYFSGLFGHYYWEKMDVDNSNECDYKLQFLLQTSDSLSNFY
ncbi:hypothetical protein DMUE_5612 [Dictyocoela muelleri]|nr:hypothetical protein DMUE_5612 [Dictyocoela muelleri]